MYGTVGVLILLALSVSLFAESETILEAVLASIVIAVDERRELEDAVVTGATGGDRFRPPASGFLNGGSGGS